MDESVYGRLREQWPFMTVGRYLDDYQIGIVQNSDNQFISMYCYERIPDEEMRRLFVHYGEMWWYGSNRQIPINVFIGNGFRIFKPYLKAFVRKDFDVLAGPIVSLQDVLQKRIKRRSVQLVKKVEAEVG